MSGLEWIGLLTVVAIVVGAIALLVALVDEAVRAARQARRFCDAFEEAGMRRPRFWRMFRLDWMQSYETVSLNGLGPFPHDPTKPVPAGGDEE